MPTPDFIAILQVLAKHKADFIVVGGLSAVLHGVPVVTMDMDVVHSRHEENLPRILAALRELDGWYRLRSDKKLIPKESHLRSPGHQLLRTIYGELDLLGWIDDGWSDEHLERPACLLEVG